MKPALIIISIVAAVAIFFAIWFAIKNKKATAANKVLDPNGVVTPAVVAATASNPATAASIADTTAVVADSIARSVKK